MKSFILPGVLLASLAVDGTGAASEDSAVQGADQK